jgi:hypothetical protein
MMRRLKLWVIGGNLNLAGRAKKSEVLSSQRALVAGGPFWYKGSGEHVSQITF